MLRFKHITRRLRNIKYRSLSVDVDEDRKKKTAEEGEEKENREEEREEDDDKEVKEIYDMDDENKQKIQRSQHVVLSMLDGIIEKLKDGIVKCEMIRRKYFIPVDMSCQQKKMPTCYQGKGSTNHENNGISQPHNKELHSQTAKRSSCTYYKANDEDAGRSNSEYEEELRGPPCKKKKANEQIRKISNSNTTKFKFSLLYSAKGNRIKTLPQRKCRTSKRNVLKEREYAKGSKFSNEEEHFDNRTNQGVTNGRITEKILGNGVLIMDKGSCSIPKVSEQVNDKGPCQTKGYHRYQKPFDDTLTTSVVKKLGKNSDSVGVLISFGRMVGTVFCAGERYVLTANHVIQTIPEKCRYRNRNTFVNFNESPLTPVKVVFHLEKLAFSDPKLDVAVLEVSNPEGLPQAMKLNKQDHDKQNIKKVSVIGFGHPSHQMKTLDPGCSLIAPDSWRIHCTQFWIREKNAYYKSVLNNRGHSHTVDNELGVLKDFNFIMDSFIEQGASGAPTIAAFGNGSLKVTGLVTHGAPEFYHLLHTFFKKDNFPSEHRYAMGTKMKDIYSSIRGKDPKLAHALFR